MVMSPRFGGQAEAAVDPRSGLRGDEFWPASPAGSAATASPASAPSGASTTEYPAPDAALDYQPATLTDHSDKDPPGHGITRPSADSGPGADPVGSAALMLVMHDLMGARYPGGPLDVDALEAWAAGRAWGARSPEVLMRARSIKADAVGHSHLRPPFTLTAPPAIVCAGPRPFFFFFFFFGRVDGSAARPQGAGVSGVPVRAAGPSSIQWAHRHRRDMASAVYVATDGETQLSVTATTPTSPCR